MTQFERDIKDADITERIIMKRLQKKGFIVKKVPHKKYPYDLIAQRGAHIFSIEVKSCGCNEAFFETRSTAGNIPEYLRFEDQVSCVIRYNWQSKRAFIIDNTTLAPFIKTCGYRERINKANTAYGITLDVTSPAIGFIKELL